MTDPATRSLREYYEYEAAAGTRGAVSGRRVDAVTAFATLLAYEGRSTVLDIGAGPGTDADVFAAAGVAYTGVDLAVGNGQLARDRGHRVVAGSLFDLPFRDVSQSAGWSMSTLMHVPLDRFDRAMSGLLRPMKRGAPVGIGMWGGVERDVMSEPDERGTRRLFSLRSADRNRTLLEGHGAVERFDVWDVGPVDWEYHYAILRAPGRDDPRRRLAAAN